MISILTAAEYRRLRDDMFLARRIIQIRLQRWERWEATNADERSAPIQVSLPKQSHEDLLEIGRELEELLALTDSSWAMRN
jgi:hypothetical protein